MCEGLGYIRIEGIGVTFVDHFPCNVYQHACTTPCVRLGKRGYISSHPILILFLYASKRSSSDFGHGRRVWTCTRLFSLRSRPLCLSWVVLASESLLFELWLPFSKLSSLSLSLLSCSCSSGPTASPLAPLPCGLHLPGFLAASLLLRCVKLPYSAHRYTDKLLITMAPASTASYG